MCVDALRAIVAYSASAEELLKRQKVHRGAIFQYLAEKGIIVSPQAEKAALISTVCQYWLNIGSNNNGGITTTEVSCKHFVTVHVNVHQLLLLLSCIMLCICVNSRD